MKISAGSISQIPDGTQVRYIKLGEGGDWEKECIEKDIIRIGFGSERKFQFCIEGQWDRVENSYIEDEKSKGTATRFTNETRLFFEDKGSILWITFVGERLYWSFLESDKPQRHVDGNGTWRKVKGGWQCKDINGNDLTKDKLSGALTKLAAYRGTSCNVDVAEYVILRINGQKIPQVECAIDALKKMNFCVQELMTLLGPKDFELLVDLVFSTSGWRRQGAVGGTQKTKDLFLTLPSTGESAFVQVKSKTNSSELKSYIDQINNFPDETRMFYIYHSGEAKTDDDRVTLIGPQKLADLVVNAGLINWLISKVSIEAKSTSRNT